jgi:hypothetical protein
VLLAVAVVFLPLICRSHLCEASEKPLASLDHLENGCKNFFARLAAGDLQTGPLALSPELQERWTPALATAPAAFAAHGGLRDIRIAHGSIRNNLGQIEAVLETFSGARVRVRLTMQCGDQGWVLTAGHRLPDQSAWERTVTTHVHDHLRREIGAFGLPPDREDAIRVLAAARTQETGTVVAQILVDRQIPPRETIWRVSLTGSENTWTIASVTGPLALDEPEVKAEVEPMICRQNQRIITQAVDYFNRNFPRERLPAIEPADAAPGGLLDERAMLLCGPAVPSLQTYELTMLPLAGCAYRNQGDLAAGGIITCDRHGPLWLPSPSLASPPADFY